MNSRDSFDVVIAGAGPAGGVIAARLAAGGLRTLLAEAGDFSELRAGEFLAPHACAQIRVSGLLRDNWEQCHTPVHEFVSAWGSSNRVFRNYILDAHGAALALDRRVFDLQIANAAVQRGVRLLTRARVRRLRLSSNECRIDIDHCGNLLQVRSQLLVVCCGRAGAAIHELPIKRSRLDQLVVVGLRVQGYSGNACPAVEAYSRGWVYSIGVGHVLLVYVFTEADSHFPNRIRATAGFVLEELVECPIATSRLRAAHTKSAASVSCFATAAMSSVARPLVGERWCVGGDYAQAFDPLSSKGILSAFEGAELIAGSILGAASLDAVDFSRYKRLLDEEYATYLNERARFYGIEQRWPTPFWLRRNRIPPFSA